MRGWVKISLTVLALASLFALKQVDLKAPPAQAQTPPPPAITILANNLTFSVTGAGIGSATQAKVSYQTQKVYVNGIKLQNTTATSQQFNLQVGFDTSHAGSMNYPPLIGQYTGYDTCGYNRTFSGNLNAYETRAVPNNLACADITYYATRTNGNGAQNVFQVAASRGWNTADLYIKLDPAYYNNWANNFQKISNALIWPAAKVTVTDILANPSQYNLNLRLPDNSTRPSLGKTLYSAGGATQYFGAALLDTPGPNTKYTITTSGINGNEQIPIGSLTAADYAFYQQTVSVSKPNVTLTASPDTIGSGQGSTLSWTSSNATALTIDNGVGSVTPLASGSKSVSPTQTTTYTITATGPSGTATASAKVTVALPDLVPDLSNLKIAVLRNNGSVTDFAVPLTYGRGSANKMLVRNLTIKNIGQGNFSGTLVIAIRSVEDALGGKDYQLSTNVSVGAGQSVVIDPYVFFISDEEDRAVFEQMLFEITRHSNQASFGYRVTLDPTNLIGESDENNNVASLPTIIKWGAVKLHLISAANGSPVNMALIAWSSSLSNTFGPNTVTDKNGFSVFAPTDAPKATYYPYITWGLKVLEERPQINVDSATVVSQEVKVTESLLGVAVNLSPERANRQTPSKSPLTPSLGYVDIAEQANPQNDFVATIQNGIASFDKFVKPGIKYVIVEDKSNAEIDWSSGSLVFTWPEKTRINDYPSQDPSTNGVVDFGVTPVFTLEMVLPKICDLKTLPGTKICLSDQRDKVSQSKLDPWTKALADSIVPMQNWSTYPLKQLDSALITKDPMFPDDYGLFSPEANRMDIDSRGDLLTSLVTTHEMFHKLDFVDYNVTGQLSSSSSFAQPLRNLLGSDTGRKLWDEVAWDQSSAYKGDYLRRIGLTRQPVEAFATMMSHLCGYKQRAINKLNNVNGELATDWKIDYNTELPADYPTYKDILYNLWRGRDGQGVVQIEQFDAWFNRCLAN